VLFVFSRTHQQTLVQGLYPTRVGGSLCHRRNDRSFGTKRVSVSLDKLSTILLSGFEDALLSGTSCAESCHERAILAAQDDYVWIRLVEVVAERWKLELFYL
jgi:hypothetical protein